jgi:ppGpp synthetase/RelA/SpoT-type nucleotidyltranferase
MAATMDQPGHILDAQVAAFRKAVPLYREMSRVLERELGQLARQVCPGAMVSARAKTVASFAEKILRKNKYRDPLQEITDLCGARVIVDLLAQVAEVGALIRQNFTVDEDNTVDASARLSASEFGYRSVHYIVSFRRDRHPGLPAKFYGAKVEVQVRTSAQHAWSAVGHDRIYKSPYPVPEALLRDAARIAAQLESADDEFARMVKELEEYHHNVEVYLPGGKLDAEVKLQDTIARHDPGNAAVALRRAQLALAADRWMVAIGVVRNFPGSGTPALRAILGHALCRLHSGDPRSPAYRRGQKCLLQAAEAMPADAGTWVRLADTYEHGEPARALRYYRAAYAADAADPAALIGCIRLQMAVTGEKEFVTLLRPAIEAAIRRCEAQAALQIELPAALYHAAVLHLLLEPDDRYEALRSLARAIWRTQTPSPIRVALGTVQVMARLHPDRADIEYARRLLQLAWHARSPDAKSRKTVKRLATPNATPIAGPVVIVVGFCDPKLRKNVPAARKILRAALRGFRGTIISGGTRQGVAGLAGELGADSGGAIRTIGYLPKTLPGNRSATRDERYTEIRLSQGKAGFSPVEPLQNWADLLVSGIAPETVTVLGIGGGQIAAVEYRLALALGARGRPHPGQRAPGGRPRQRSGMGGKPSAAAAAARDPRTGNAHGLDAPAVRPGDV